VRPRPADLLLVALQFLERGHQGPGPERAVGVRRQPHDAVAAPVLGLEPEDRLDRVAAGAHHLARRRAVWIDLDMRRPARGAQSLHDGVAAADRLEPPGERQHVAPMAVSVEQGRERCRVGFLEA
jgi:hypothetical protein